MKFLKFSCQPQFQKRVCFSFVSVDLFPGGQANYPSNIFQTGNCIFKVNNRNTRTMREICSKLTIKTPEWRQSRRYGVFIVNFEHTISHLVLAFDFCLFVCLFFQLAFDKSFWYNKKRVNFPEYNPPFVILEKTLYNLPESRFFCKSKPIQYLKLKTRSSNLNCYYSKIFHLYLCEKKIQKIGWSYIMFKIFALKKYCYISIFRWRQKHI